MNTSTTRFRENTLRRSLPIAFAIGALAIMSARAHADDLDQITISAPVEKTVGREAATLAPIQEVTVTARVTADAAALTTNSGVAILNDSVLAAARKACEAADPSMLDDDTCVDNAVRSAKPQIDAAIARARSTANS
jgi:UrcA family protein